MGSDLPAEALRELLAYNPDTGVFVWRQNHQFHKVAGKRAGTLSRAGYRYISIKGHKMLAHRLAWLYVHGVWPDGLIDHINGDPDDNRIANLRVATHGENMQNRQRANRNNSTGMMGVRRYYNRWRAVISVGRTSIPLGIFDSPEEAHEAYLAAKRELHPFWRDVGAA